MFSSIFTSIQKYLFKSALYNSIIEQSIKKSALKKILCIYCYSFFYWIVCWYIQTFKCLKNILKTFIHLKTYDVFICKEQLSKELSDMVIYMKCYNWKIIYLNFSFNFLGFYSIYNSISSTTSSYNKVRKHIWEDANIFLIQTA